MIFQFYSEMIEKGIHAWGAGLEMVEYARNVPGPYGVEIKAHAVQIWENRTKDDAREEGYGVFQMYDPRNALNFKTDAQVENWQELLNQELKEEGFPIRILMRRQWFNQKPDDKYEIFVLQSHRFETVRDWITETEADKEAA